jgi:hypothetical protein
MSGRAPGTCMSIATHLRPFRGPATPGVIAPVVPTRPFASTPRFYVEPSAGLGTAPGFLIGHSKQELAR